MGGARLRFLRLHDAGFSSVVVRPASSAELIDVHLQAEESRSSCPSSMTSDDRPPLIHTRRRGPIASMRKWFHSPNL